MCVSATWLAIYSLLWGGGAGTAGTARVTSKVVSGYAVADGEGICEYGIRKFAQVSRGPQNNLPGWERTRDGGDPYRATYKAIKAAIHRVTPTPAHPPRSVSPPPVGGGSGSGARPAPRPTPQTGGLCVCHTCALTAPQRGESNAGFEIPMMVLPNDSAIASLPAAIPSSTLYRASPDAD